MEQVFKCFWCWNVCSYWRWSRYSNAFGVGMSVVIGDGAGIHISNAFGVGMSVVVGDGVYCWLIFSGYDLNKLDLSEVQG